MKVFTIYKITSPSGKVYIGQTGRIKQRIKEYKYNLCKNQYLIYNSINKHGFNRHCFEILFTDLTKEEANDIEIELIEKYKQEGVSLNINKGGYDTSYFAKQIVQLEINGKIVKIYESMSEAERLHNMYPGKLVHYFFNKRRINQSLCNGYFWVILEDYKKGNYDLKINKNSKRQILKLTKEGCFLNEYSSVLEAARLNDIIATSIYNCLHGRSKSAGNYVWKYKC